MSGTRAGRDPVSARSWPPEALEILHRAYREGWYASRTADEINRVCGMAKTRCAIIGKAHRLGIVEGSPCQNQPGPPRPRKAYPKREPKPPKARPAPKFELYTPDFSKGLHTMRVDANGGVTEAAPAIPMKPLRRLPTEGEGITLMQVTNHTCRWPLLDLAPDDTREQRFCGCKPKGDGPYCEGHAEIARGKAPETLKVPRSGVRTPPRRAVRPSSPWDLDYGDRAA